MPGTKSVAQRIGSLLETAWREARESQRVRQGDESRRLGVIFASTKGCVEDYIWSKTPTAADASADPYSPVLDDFLARTGLQATRRLTISNACSSAHVALELATRWLDARVVDRILILSADVVGPFIVDGFASLKSLAADKVTPFGAGRQGIQLGDAAAALLIGRDDEYANALVRLRSVDTRAEGYALTRSNEAGGTLEASCRASLGDVTPDAVIAHATGTPANDAMENEVYARLFAGDVEITGSKWCVGHTLGASGAVDIIAAAECLARREIFAIGNTTTIDEKFRGRYLVRGTGGARPSLRRILVASAGFGGMHGTALLERP